MVEATAVNTQSFRAEDRVLLCCARAQMDATTARQLQELVCRNLNWTDLLKAAAFHGIDPLLYIHLNAVCPGDVPTAVRDELRASTLAVARRSLVLTMDLLKLLDAFAAAGIRAVSFKGPVLAATAYRDANLRDSLDLDILIHSSDLQPAIDLLFAGGYRKLLADGSGIAFRHHGRQCSYVNRTGETVIDLHWDMTPGFLPLKTFPEQAWSRVEPVSFNGRTVLSFCPEDLLVLLCIHGGKHLCTRLRWICDVAEVIRSHPQMDWRAVMQGAASAGATRMLHTGLALAAELVDAPLPDAVKQAIQRDVASARIAAKLKANLFSVPSHGLTELQRVRLHLELLDNRGSRIRYCWSRLTEPTEAEWQAVKLPPALLPLYSVLRPLRLAGKYGRELFRPAATVPSAPDAK